MKVRSKLADIDFEIGRFEYKRDHLIIHSEQDRSMQGKVYVSPDDITRAFARALVVPRVWLYLLFFPFFLIRYRRRHAQRKEK